MISKKNNVNKNNANKNVRKNIAKLVVAVVLTLATIFGGGIAAEEIGLDITPSAFAAGNCGSSTGGGC